MTPQDPTWAELEATGSSTAPRPVVPPPSRVDSKPPVKTAAEHWRSGADVVVDTTSKVEWVWRDYLARGTVTELDGKVKVSGKTTFCHHLSRAILDGEPFLDRPTLRGPVVYLTEEGPATFERALHTRGLKGKADFHYLSKRHVSTVTWTELVALARAKVIETGAVLLVVDTLGKLAGFQGDDENSAGRVMSAMLPLQALATELNIAVVVTRHERRAGGQVGESARGSTAISGDVDQILQLTRTGGDAHQSERWLKAVGRYDETPAELRIELDRGSYRVVGPDDARNRAGEALLDMLQPGEPQPVVDMLQDLADQGHSRKAVYDAVARLVGDGQLGEVEDVGPSGHRRKAIVSRTSNARASLSVDLDSDGNSQNPTSHPRSEGDRLALPTPFVKGGSSETTTNGPVASLADVLRLFPGSKPVESDLEGGL
jgi:hypothetical protein